MQQVILLIIFVAVPKRVSVGGKIYYNVFNYRQTVFSSQLTLK